MDMLMCGDGTTNPQDSFPSNSSMSDASSSTDDEDVMLECDYDTCPTKLYQSVEDKKWEEISFFLETGSWNNTLWLACGGMLGGNEPDPPRVEARTWVTAMDSNGRVRWCQLPLHAAITFQAPLSIIQKLVEAYPKSARCADDQGLLPLHYAFRFGAPDDVVGCLVQAFPQAIRKRAAKNRLPLDLAPFSSKPERGYIIERFVDSAVKEAKILWDAEHETKLLQQQEYQEHQQRRGINPSKADFINEELERRLHRKNQKLSRAMKDLKQTQKQLNALQRKLNEAAKEVTAATSTSAPPSRATYGRSETKDEPEVNSILGPYYHEEGGDQTGEDRDDDDVSDRVEHDPTAIQASQQQQQQQKEQYISHKVKKTPASSYSSSLPPSPRSGHSRSDDRSRRSATDDRSRRSTRTNATDDQSRRSVRSMSVEDGSYHHGCSRSRSVTRKRSSSYAAKRVIRNIFQGLRGKV